MEDGYSFTGDHAPSQTMGLDQKLAAFVEIRTNRLFGCCFEMGEEPPDKSIGNTEADTPATIMETDSWGKQLFFLILNGDQTGQIINAGAKTKEHSSVGIELKIEVTQIIFLRVEEKLQSAEFNSIF